MYLQQVKEKFVEGVSQSALSPHDLAQNEIAVNKQDEMQIKKKTLTHYTPGNVYCFCYVAPLRYTFRVLFWLQAPNCITIVEFDRFVFSLFILQQLRGQ